MKMNRIDISNNELFSKLNIIGYNNVNSISYKINNNAIIKNPKLIDTRKACVLVKPHSYTFSLALWFFNL